MHLNKFLSSYILFLILIFCGSFSISLSQVFYGREDTLERIKNHMLGNSDKPLVLYGEGGCGKTSLLAKSAGLTSSIWLSDRKPISIIRFLGTTPDSSALTPTLISICQQVSVLYVV